MTSKTSPESPLPIRTVLQMVGGWIGKLGTVWVEGQITDLTARGGTVFLTLRDPVADVSRPGSPVPRGVYEATVPRPADGARVVVHVKPDFWVNRGSFAFTALEIRAGRHRRAAGPAGPAPPVAGRRGPVRRRTQAAAALPARHHRPDLRT